MQVERRKIGRDVLFVVSGGAVHIGAVSTAYPQGSEIAVTTVSVPGHKEYLLSESAAQRAAKQLNCTVTVMMGIHYDDLTPTQIEEVSHHVFERFEQALHSPL
ncbi:hypothetical protein B9G55_04830 [Saccharibacillus sp. O16]|nr:hypothetical protein B9G55_04830 [Saccharibacillus sp. O16]